MKLQNPRHVMLWRLPSMKCIVVSWRMCVAITKVEWSYPTFLDSSLDTSVEPGSVARGGSKGEGINVRQGPNIHSLIQLEA